MSITNVMFVGVGGQGSLLASRLLGEVVIKKGFDVKVSEVHGMSQRGGSVVTYVRFGEKVYSPIIEQGEADIILGFEMLEGARALPFLAKDGTLIINTQQIDPMPVITGAAQYPAEALGALEKSGAKVFSIDALPLAESAGSPKAVNIVLLGCMAKKLGFSKDDFLKAIDSVVAERFKEMNRKAFEMGFERA